MTLEEARALAAKHIDVDHRKNCWRAISMSDVITDAAYAILEALATRPPEPPCDIPVCKEVGAHWHGKAEPTPPSLIPCRVCGMDGYCGTHNDRNDDNPDDEPTPPGGPTLTARELLRAAAQDLEYDGNHRCHALRELADRIDAEMDASRDVMIGNNAIRAILLARLDAPLEGNPR